MVTYIKSDLEFILAQIKLAEAHAAGQPLYGPGLDGIFADNPATPEDESADNGLLPTYNLSFGLRTVDGSYNHLLPGQERWGASDRPFVELMTPDYRTVMGPVDINGPAPGGVVQFPFPYTPGVDPDGPMPNAGTGDVIDPSIRTISNLLVDQTLGNPAAILTALQNAGIEDPGLVITRQISQAFAPLKLLFKALQEAEREEAEAAAAFASADPINEELYELLEQAALDAAEALANAQDAVDVAAGGPLGLYALLAANGVEMQGSNIQILNTAPDEGLSAPFNSWFTLFGQFFDHGLDLVNKGGSGTVLIPLQPDDPLYDPTPGAPNFMVLTRATVSAGPDGDWGTADDVRPLNTTTAYVDQNQTYTSHPSHQVFLRQYEMTDDGPAATGKLIEGANGGMATWGELKAQARTMLGIDLQNVDVGKVPLLRTDPYGNFIPGDNGYPQLIYGIGADLIPNTGDDLVVEGDPDNPVNPSNLFDADLSDAIGAIRTNHAFLADIAHNAVPEGLEDGDITIGLDNGDGSQTDGQYDDELLDAHFIAGDGRVNENIGLTAVHHVFHSEHNRLADHTKITTLETRDVAFVNEWLKTPLTAAQTLTLLNGDAAALEDLSDDLTWDGERVFQAAKFGTEMQYQHLVFEEFARKVQPTINTFLVPDGFDTLMDPSIFAEFAHVVYRFGHSMLTESIDKFDANFNADHISLIQGFLNPTAFTSTDGVDDDVVAGAIVRGMTRQVGNEIDEFVTTALRNNLLGLPLDLATINLARGRDTGVPSLNEARRTFYEATNQDERLKPYESWIDFAGHLKHEASIINFIAAYGTHQTILDATTIEDKREAAMALVGLTATGSESIFLANASFEALDLSLPGPGDRFVTPLGIHTLSAPVGWNISNAGGLFDPEVGITNGGAIDGNNVVWLGATGVLSKDTIVVLEEGSSYSLTFDIGDRTDLGWPGATARLVSSDGTVLAEQVIAAPGDGQWATISFQTDAITADVAGQTLSIVVEQTNLATGQILLDDFRLNVLRPVTLDEDDRQAFLNGTGIYADDLGGLEDVDLWIGGLAEEIMPFGGMLGSTFNFVFEQQMELLQSGDRFYYLQRLDGLHLFGEMENNSFAAMIMRNTDATHLPSDVFSTPGLILEVDQSRQFNDLDGDGQLDSDDPVGSGILAQVVTRNNPGTIGPDANYLRYSGDEHVVLGGTDDDDILIAGIGDDTLFGDAGNDSLEGGFGNDILNAGDGDDIIKDSGGDDNIKAGRGHDVVHAGPGLDLVMGNDGQDFIFLGTDEGSEVFAGTGNDFIYGNRNAERILGNEGNDWIETGTFDGAPGDNFDEIFAHDGIDGHDVFIGDGGFDEFIGEGGDDIMVGSTGRGKMAGMSGFDWATYKDSMFAVNADLSVPIIFDEAPTLPQNASLDEYESMEGLSGSRFNDVLSGTDDVAADRASLADGGTTGYRGSVLDAEGIALINGLQAVLGAGVTSFDGGDIILGGDGSDIIQGNGGDDVIDGDKWLNVRIGIMSGFDEDGPTGAEVAGNPGIKSMTSLVTLRVDANGNVVTAPTGGTPTTKALSAWMFDGQINPGQLQIIREITTAGADAVADIDTARYQGTRGEYAFSATADGQVIVSHAVDDSLDGTDRLRNIERVQFSDGNALNIIVGTPNNDVLNGTLQDDLILGLAGGDVLNGGLGNDILVGGADGNSGTFVDDFSNGASYTDNDGTLNFNGGWIESVGETTSPVVGDININGGRLRFQEGIDGGETISRAANLAGFTSAVLSFAWEGDDLDFGENVSVQAFNGTTWDNLVTLGGDQTDTYSVALTSAQIGAHTAIRFVANGTFEAGENFFVDNFTLTASSVDTLNGGLGDDTYSFTLGDGNDIINESVSATSGGAADRISILAPSTGIDPLTDLPIRTLTSLNASDSNTGTQTGDLVISYAMPTGAQQTITVAGHFAGANAQTGVERINFNGATYAGYQLGGDDYLISRLDPANRDGGGLNLSASIASNFLVGENGVNDVITGGGANDLIFGGTGDNDLFGGDGDDLLVGGSNAGDDDLLDGGIGADTMIGGVGNDIYVVDDLADVVVETAGQGTDTVETLMAALSIEFMANVENLSYEGIDADPFVGTGNAGNNVISGGDLDDMLSGLAGDDTLNGGLGNNLLFGGVGNDTLNGGDGNDTFVGGSGNDTINVGDGFNTLTYNTVNFGNDIVTSFDSVGGTAATQDLIDLSALGITAANFATRVTIADIEDGATDDTLITVRDAANVVIGTVRLEELEATGVNGVTIADFILSTAGNVITGTPAGATHNGTANADTINALGGDDTVNAGAGNDIVNGGAGNDVLNGDAGDDTFNWNANAALPTDGRDVINGGLEGVAGDAFVLTGNATGETFRIYTRAAFLAVAGNAAAPLAAATEIVVTRNGTNDAAIIAELSEIEEIRINGVDATGATGPAGAGDSFIVIGDFSTTSLRQNTITIDGDAGDDNIDISSLDSSHRIVFRSNGGNDTIVGTLRPQDVIELPDGASPDDYEVIDNGNGTFTLVSAIHRITFTGTGVPELWSTPSNVDDAPNGAGDDVQDDAEDAGLNQAGTSGDDAMTGTSGNDALRGGSGDDALSGGSGHDDLGGGSGDDRLVGGSGNDKLSGGSGDDDLNGGSGDDELSGGSGDDRLTGGSGDDLFAFDGDDVITDFKVGEDRIDLRSLGITAATFASLVEIKAAGPDALVTVGGETMRLSGVSAAALSENAFSLDDDDEALATVGTEMFSASLYTAEDDAAFLRSIAGQDDDDFVYSGTAATSAGVTTQAMADIINLQSPDAAGRRGSEHLDKPSQLDMFDEDDIAEYCSPDSDYFL